MVFIAPGNESSVGLILNSLDVAVGKAEMMADFMYEHVRHNLSKRIFMLRPIIEDRPAVEPDHIWHEFRHGFGLKWQSDALKQAKQVEFRSEEHTSELQSPYVI